MVSPVRSSRRRTSRGSFTASTARQQTAYTVSYNSESHISVLTQMWGSKWPKVLPFCLCNVALMLLLTFLDEHYDLVQLEMTTQGHSFIAVVVSFLLISRVNIGLGRYNQARGHLRNAYSTAVKWGGHVDRIMSAGKIASQILAPHMPTAAKEGIKRGISQYEQVRDQVRQQHDKGMEVARDLKTKALPALGF